MTDRPGPGDVFAYHYLWKREARSGENSGRKKRPVCVAIVIANNDAETLVFMAPITTKAPGPSDAALPVAEIEAKRAGLDARVRSWVIVGELNADIWERSYVLEDREPLGSFSPAFTRKIVEAIHEIRQSGNLGLSSRR